MWFFSVPATSYRNKEFFEIISMLTYASAKTLFSPKLADVESLISMQWSAGGKYVLKPCVAILSM